MAFSINNMNNTNNDLALLLLASMMRSNPTGAMGMGGCPGCQQQMPFGDAFNGSPDLNSRSPVGSIPNFAGLGGVRPGGGASPGGAGGPAGAAPAGGAEQAGAGGGGAAARAVDVAKKYEGQDSKSLKGKLPGFTAPGGNTNNCAAFVSACLEHTGALPKGGGSASVATLRQKLQKAGWKKVPPQQAQKGAVWMTKPGQGSHTELVAAPGGKQTIGSNNVRQGFQKITSRNKNAGSGEVWQSPNG